MMATLFGKSEIDRKIELGHRWSDKSEFFRDYYESMKGKRDAFSWWVGLIVPIGVISSAVLEYKQLKEQSVPAEVLQALWNIDAYYLVVVLVVCLSFFFRQRWARYAAFAVPFIGAILTHLEMSRILRPEAISQLIGSQLGAAFWWLLLYTAMINASVPNKAFFGIPVNENAIEKYWGAVSNRWARYAALVGFVFPWVIFALADRRTGAILALACCGLAGWLSLKAFKNYSPNSVPPILGRGYAVFGLLAALGWVGVFVTRLARTV